MIYELHNKDPKHITPTIISKLYIDHCTFKFKSKFLCFVNKSGLLLDKLNGAIVYLIPFVVLNNELYKMNKFMFPRSKIIEYIDKHGLPIKTDWKFKSTIIDEILNHSVNLLNTYEI